MSPPAPAADEPLPPDAPPTLRISGPAQILQIVPYLLGFHPECSVVIVALRGRTVLVSARYNMGAPPLMAEPLCRAAFDSGADRVIAIIYDDAIDGVPLAHRDYLDALKGVFDRHALTVVDALAVTNGRWWSYLCHDDACCPREGTALESAGIAAVGAVAEGLVALPGRADLEAELQPDASGVAKVLTALQRLEETHDERPDVVVRAGHWAAVRRFVRLARRGAGPPTPDEAARVLWALTDLSVRDATVGFLAARPEAEVSKAWRGLVRVAPPPWRAPVATVYALWCFAAGSGARSNIAVDVALDADPCYSMAQLLSEAQSSGINPFDFISAVAGECQLVGRRIQRKRPPWGRRQS
jgi:hypothetical protein